MWIDEQESTFCNEFTANSFVLLPSEAQFGRRHLTSAHRLWARLVTHSAYLWRTQGQQKLLTHHHHFFGKAKYPFKKNQTYPPIPGSWRCHQVRALATAQRHFTKGQPRHNSHCQKQLFSSWMLLWGQTTPWSAAWWFWTPAHHSQYFMVLFLWTSLSLPALEEAACHMLSGMFWNRNVSSGGKYSVLFWV